MKHPWLNLLLLPVLIGARATNPDSVLWSDGRTWNGTLHLPENRRLSLHDGKRIRPVALEDLARIDWSVETQRMERAWTFVEAGRTEKRFEGEPYPVRHWKTRITLRNGDVLQGQLISTVFYLENNEEGTTRLVVRSKQRGKPGETPDDLVAPVALSLGHREGQPEPRKTVLRFRVAEAPEALTAGVASLNPTLAPEVHREEPGLYRFSLEGTHPVLALRLEHEVRVGWPGSGDPELTARIEAALPKVRDFFDERRVLAVHRDPEEPDRVHSLLLLLREGRTTLGGPRPNPWHVEVWTFRLGETDRLLFEGRAVLARDLRHPSEPPPRVLLDASLLPPGPWEEDPEFRWN